MKSLRIYWEFLLIKFTIELLIRMNEVQIFTKLFEIYENWKLSQLQEFYTDIKPELLDPSLVEVIDPKASNEPTEQSMRVEVKEEEVDYEGMVEIKEEGEEDEYEATEEYAEEEPDREMRKKVLHFSVFCCGYFQLVLSSTLICTAVPFSEKSDGQKLKKLNDRG